MEEEPSGFSHQDEKSIRNDSFDFEISADGPKSENIREKLQDFQNNRIKRFLMEISQQQRRELKLKFEHRKLLDKI